MSSQDLSTNPHVEEQQSKDMDPMKEVSVEGLRFIKLRDDLPDFIWTILRRHHLIHNEEGWFIALKD